MDHRGGDGRFLEELKSSRSVAGENFPNFEIPFLIVLTYSRSLFATIMLRISMRDGMKYYHQ